MKSDRWSKDLDALTNSFNSEFASLTADEINWKPNAQKWSVAQCIHHLIVVNESYYPILDQVRNKTYYTPRYGKIGFITKFFGKIVLDAVNPDRRKKMKTTTELIIVVEQSSWIRFYKNTRLRHL